MRNWVRTACFLWVLLVSLVGSAFADTPYKIDGLSLNEKVKFGSSIVDKYACEPSTFFASTYGVKKKEKKQSAKGQVTKSNSLLHNSDGTVLYLSLGIFPAYFKSGEIQAGDRTTKQEVRAKA